MRGGGRLLVGLLRKVGGRCFLYVLFVADLHSGLLCCIFAVAREVRGRFPFLDSHPPNGPPTPEGGFSILILTCERASLSFSFGPNEVLSVAVLQSRLGQMRKLMGRIGRIRRVGENAV